MRTTALLVMLLLTLGIGWGSAPAIAGDNVAIEQLQASSKPMTDAELGQVRGKLLSQNNFGSDFGKLALGQNNFGSDFGKLVHCIFNKLPEDTQARICKAMQIIRCLSSCKDRSNGVQAALR